MHVDGMAFGNRRAQRLALLARQAQRVNVGSVCQQVAPTPIVGPVQVLPGHRSGSTLGHTLIVHDLCVGIRDRLDVPMLAIALKKVGVLHCRWAREIAGHPCYTGSIHRPVPKPIGSIQVSPHRCASAWASPTIRIRIGITHDCVWRRVPRIVPVNVGTALQSPRCSSRLPQLPQRSAKPRGNRSWRGHCRQPAGGTSHRTQSSGHDVAAAATGDPSAPGTCQAQHDDVFTRCHLVVHMAIGLGACVSAHHTEHDVVAIPSCLPRGAHCSVEIDASARLV
mmetsp:Transcript_60098/g.161170  ORF Transcript_60098/g.161170 Transcript_60098/m.161170 type:complete len:280 (-) Transcript_60098:918-1757(-)